MIVLERSWRHLSSPGGSKTNKNKWFFNVFALRAFRVLWVMLEPTWLMLEPLGLLLAPSWVHVGVIWSLLASSWLQLGATWRPKRASWRHLGASWEPLGRSWSHLRPLWRDETAAASNLAPCGTNFGPFQLQFGSIWEAPRSFLGCLQIVFDQTWMRSNATKTVFK